MASQQLCGIFCHMTNFLWKWMAEHLQMYSYNKFEWWNELIPFAMETAGIVNDATGNQIENANDIMDVWQQHSLIPKSLSYQAPVRKFFEQFQSNSIEFMNAIITVGPRW